jgi:Alpha-L-fucosidase
VAPVPALDRRDFIRLAGLTAGTALPLAGPHSATAAPLVAARGTHRRGGNLYAAQKAMVDRRFGMFIHFNMATYHDMEWVDPGQDPASFNPVDLDCGQWADAAAAAGMTFAVLTAKHHDGFCLWPSAYTDYGVKSSSYRHDIVRQFVDAFRARGITPCLYFSIWDRTQGVAAGAVTPDAMRFVQGQLTELLTHYGHIPMLMTDGWSWSCGPPARHRRQHHGVPGGGQHRRPAVPGRGERALGARQGRQTGPVPRHHPSPVRTARGARRAARLRRGQRARRRPRAQLPLAARPARRRCAALFPLVAPRPAREGVAPGASSSLRLRATPRRALRSGSCQPNSAGSGIAAPRRASPAALGW